MGLIELFTQVQGGGLSPGGTTVPAVEEGTEEGQKTMSHCSNELHIPSKCLLVSQT